MTPHPTLLGSRHRRWEIGREEYSAGGGASNSVAHCTVSYCSATMPCCSCSFTTKVGRVALGVPGGDNMDRVHGTIHPFLESQGTKLKHTTAASTNRPTG